MLDIELFRTNLADIIESENKRFKDPSNAEKVLELDKTVASEQEEKISEVIFYDEPLLDFSDSDKLRKAILHFEILGKPLSLRDYR